MKPFEYLKLLIKPNSGNSSKSFGLVISAIVGGFAGLCVCFVLLYDVIVDGIIDTNLEDLGWFLICSAAYMFGGGLNKSLTDTFGDKKKTKNIEQNTPADENEENQIDRF